MFEGPGRPAQARPPLQQGDRGAPVGRLDSGGQAGEAPADHHDARAAIGHGRNPATLRRATRAFCGPGRRTRMLSGRSGCAMMRTSNRR